ncbi:hypothetical protein NDU88_006900 [Pleurodeles waltl]|uniref:Tachylectin 2 domain-containing protein n=1 Tax=Pleurodeles waltl TaxID=8319 RepID=A0AAV7WFI4_PLEWA|nr:hypothetical protein NDU88_006900 [Pleurodeles waltl]
MSKGGRAVSRAPVTYKVIPASGVPASGTGKSTPADDYESIDDATTREETVLFCIDRSNNCKIGLPPAAEEDNYHLRAMELGNLGNVSHVFFNPRGEMFVVREHELFKGPTPSARWSDWFQLAKCVGRGIWDQFKFLSFSPGGILYAVTKAGAFYKGPEPNNKHVSWLHKQATKLGGRDWQYFDVLFFDPEGIMYVILRGALLKNPPVTNILGEWVTQSVNVGKSGWDKYSHFMGFSSEGDLWCVSRNDGVMYSAPPPTHRNDRWVERAKRMGSDYRTYKHMKFTHDKTIQKILRLDFLLDSGEVLETHPEVVALQEYDNKDSTSPLKCTFEIDKTCIVETQFTHEHGFEIGFEAETTFTAKIPLVGEGGARVAASTSTSHTWNFTDINRIETHYKTSSTFELAAGKAVRQKGVVKKAVIDVPYTAEVLTVFGYKTTVSGMWKGACFFNLSVRQEDM